MASSVKYKKIKCKMRKVSPLELNKYLQDSFSKQCCVCGTKRPQLHHNLIFAGRQVDEAWTFLPLCPIHHEEARNRDFKQLMDWVMLNRANSKDLAKYSKIIDYKQRKSYLNKRFGKFSPEKIREHYVQAYHKNITSIS